MAFLRFVLEDLGYSVPLPRVLSMDNQSAIAAAKNPEHQGRMKHMNPIFHALRDSVEHGKVQPVFVPTTEQAADILTKPLDKTRVQAGIQMLGLGE